jgi:ribonucleoside-diphosphate reductase alpha chain
MVSKASDISSYQQFIHKSRYARWDYEKQRRENWDETVARYVGFFTPRIPKADREAVSAEIEKAIFHMDVMPSMRAMMTAGPALEKDNAAGYNCLGGSETFLTKDGVKTFLETAGTEQTVLSKDGKWVTAEIKSFGKQPLQEIVFKPSFDEDGRSKTNLRVRVRTTPNHRWLTTNRGEVTDLCVGDKVPFVGPSTGAFDPRAWIAGFGFGDGTIDSRGRAKVRLCGEKDRQWLHIFEGFGHSSICYPPSYGGDPVVIFHQGYMGDWKQLPLGKDANYLANWLEGYISADGHLDPHQPGLSSQNPAAIEFVKAIAPFAGYLVTGQNTSPVEDTNLGHRSSPLQRLTLRKTGIFKVQSIEALEEPEEVFCAIEPSTHTFVLGSGILTGNCTYIAVDDPRAFDEAMYLSMCGCGVGFSVERQYVNQMPMIAENLYPVDTIIKVKDSKIGWANGFRQLIQLLYGGSIPKWDLSAVRPAGAILKTMGGRASGPEPLDRLFKFCVNLFREAAGRKLNSIECHDLMCMVADIVVVGGVRRSAMLSLSNLSDERMRNAKSGAWWDEKNPNSAPWRALANNSVAYTEKPEPQIFIREFLTLIESKSGERGIFNRVAATNSAKKTGRRKWENIDFGTNPCGEINLRPKGFCNLSEVVCRPHDTKASLKRKIRLATIIGCLQSTLTDFRYLRREWQKNAEEERLLGVSLTGIMDCELMSRNGEELAKLLDELREYAIEVATEWAGKLGISVPAAITCVKPSGTVSQLVDCSAGIHSRYAPHLLRGTQEDRKSPVNTFLKAQGVPNEPYSLHPDQSDMFFFPMEAPKTSVCRNDMTALDQLELYLTYKLHWTEHNPSCTIYVREKEWTEVLAWVYKHFDIIGGVSFMPHSDHIYKQAPYRELSEEEYAKLRAAFPVVDWSKLPDYEKEDMTEVVRELACSAGSCELA